ncbi:hypothetical protein CC78DRAFT_567264 [Lojkania enalia]|uniref:Uncharacterized protein n=1 Tax=Lojkania enalia TaxID=147567 RepID=A0A9P4KC38_9PLEO|nr:hypothetical protein CC78DRAFT_567264 [Didymosphaeria enalia]
MAPDINSLPPSPSPSASPNQSRMTLNSSSDPPRGLSASPPASHTPPHSLAAAAALNAGLRDEDARRHSNGSMRRDFERARRRSSIRMNLNLNDPAIPAPGEMQMSPSTRSRPPWPNSPHHERTPSLGELHQELEYEQEGQVNRLLHMIRQQQAQIAALQSTQGAQPNSAIVDDSTPTSERSLSLAPSAHASQANLPNSSIPNSIITNQPRSRSPFQLSRHSSVAGRSRGSSHAGSPSLRPMSGGGMAHESTDWLPGSAAGARDESAFYQAETQMLTRENQMLKLRIRELERQLSELNPTSAITHSPVTPSALMTFPPVGPVRRDAPSTAINEGAEASGSTS